MNYFKQGIMPWNWAPKNTEVLWSGFDNIKNFNTNPKKQFWENIELSYKYNQYGFRYDNFDNYLNKLVDIAVGCSFVEGVGMPAESIWPSLIEQRTKIPCLNFGVGGGSTDTVARVITNIASLFKIRTVYVLWPNLERFEIYNDVIEIITPMNSKIEYIWSCEPTHSNNRFFKNQYMLQLLSKEHQFNLVERNVSTFLLNQFDTGRDNAHFGFETHKTLAESFLTGNG